MTFKGIKTSRKRKRGYALFRKGEYSWNGPIKQSIKLPNLPRKKWAGLSIALFLIFIIAIGNYGPFSPIKLVLGDYNSSFSHTRTNIFTDTALNGPTIPGYVTSVGVQVNIAAANPTGTIFVKAGDFIGVYLVSNALNGFNGWNIHDSQSNTFINVDPTCNQAGTSDSKACIVYAIATLTGNDIVTASCTPGGCSYTGFFNIDDYSGVSVVGNTANNKCGPSPATCSVTLTTSSVNSVVWNPIMDQIDPNLGNPPATCPTFTTSSSQVFRFTSGCVQTVFKGSTYDKAEPTIASHTESFSIAGGASGFVDVAGVDLVLIASTDFSKVRWNFNSTCVSLQGPQTPQAVFDYSLGSSGSKGNNCSSADIMISKASVNLQSVSGRMMEMVEEWSPNALNSPIKNVTMVLRTNATLPSFTEAYNPFRDLNARLIWQACPIQFCTGGLSSLWVVHDQTKNLNQETQGNDLIISGPNSNFNNAAGPNQNVFQVVLNYTGPLNYQQSATVTNSTNLASALQFGQDYYILLQAQFDTTQSPGALKGASFAGTDLPNNGSGDPSFGIWSVPSSCTDPANKSACSLAAAQPVFQFNPLDPSSWGNAIIKGFLWVFTVAVPGGLSIVVSVVLAILQAVLNQIGQFIGWGNIGDQFFSFAGGVITYFTTGLSDALGWLLRLISRSIDLIKVANFWVNFYLGGLLNFMADLLNVISEFVIFAQKIVTFLGSSYVLIMILFFLWYDGDEGLEGWYNWFETVKWFSFISFDFLERMINFGISSITWLFGRIPTLDGTTIPELPTIAIGGGPHFPTFEMRALREGNFAAYFGQLLGVAFLVWFETSGLPGSIGSNVTGTAAGVAAPFVTILLILISVTGLLFILNIPAQLARGAFGLNDLAKIESFRTVSTRAGGVSGRLVKKHPDKKARIVVHRGLGARGLVPQFRKPKPVSQPTAQGVG